MDRAQRLRPQHQPSPTTDSGPLTRAAAPAVDGTAQLQSSLNEAPSVQRLIGIREQLDRRPSSSGPVQLRGYTLSDIKSVVGGSFTPTGTGSQESSAPLPSSVDGVDYHYSISTSDPGQFHISYYPSGSTDPNDKYFDFRFEWKTLTEVYGPPALIRGKQWKKLIGQLGTFQSEATQLASTLAAGIKRHLDGPPPTTSTSGPSFVPPSSSGYTPSPFQQFLQEFRRQRALVPQPPPVPTGPLPDFIPLEVDKDTATDEEKPTQLHGWDRDAPVQRKLINGADDNSDEELALDAATEAIMFSAPKGVAEVWKEMVDSKDVTVILNFGDVGTGNFGHTVSKGDKIWITVDAEMLRDSDDSETNAINETQLQSTLIHEIILHAIPAYQTLKQTGKEHDAEEVSEHASLAGWTTVLETAKSVNPTVYFNSIIDAILHRKYLGGEDGKAFDRLINSIESLNFIGLGEGRILVEMGDNQEVLRQLGEGNYELASDESSDSEDSVDDVDDEVLIDFDVPETPAVRLQFDRSQLVSPGRLATQVELRVTPGDTISVGGELAKVTNVSAFGLTTFIDFSKA